MTAPARVLPAPELHLVVDRSGARRRLRGWVLFSVLVVGAFLSLIYSRIALDHSAFVIEDLEQQIARADADYWDLRLEIAELEAPARVANAAEKMGMVYPSQRTPLEVAGVEVGGTAIDQRWVELKALLSAQP